VPVGPHVGEEATRRAQGTPASLHHSHGCLCHHPCLVNKPPFLLSQCHCSPRPRCPAGIPSSRPGAAWGCALALVQVQAGGAGGGPAPAAATAPRSGLRCSSSLRCRHKEATPGLTEQRIRVSLSGFGVQNSLSGVWGSGVGMHTCVQVSRLQPAHTLHARSSPRALLLRTGEVQQAGTRAKGSMGLAAPK